MPLMAAAAALGAAPAAPVDESDDVGDEGASSRLAVKRLSIRVSDSVFARKPAFRPEARVPAQSLSGSVRAPSVDERMKMMEKMEKWQDRELPVQLFGVIRHTERADASFASVNGVSWSGTPDFLQYPTDPPLSDVGLEQAKKIALEVREFVKGPGAKLHVVVTSPYFRCVQTAIQICKQLGPGVRMLVDQSLGEVFGPEFFGESQPLSTVRPMRDILEHCKSEGVTCQKLALGGQPPWPENLINARQRFANRFLAYLRRSTKARRNFLVVTHAECVAAALSVMPSYAGCGIEKVSYGGMFLAQRQVESKPAPTSDMGGEAMGFTTSVNSEENMQMEETSPEAAEEAFQAVKEIGWQVQTAGIKMSRRTGNIAAFESRVKRLVDGSQLPGSQVKQLLGMLSDMPLGDGDELELNRSATIRRPMYQSQQTSASLSTFLFGEGSDARMSEASLSLKGKKPSNSKVPEVALSPFPLWKGQGPKTGTSGHGAVLRSQGSQGSACSATNGSKVKSLEASAASGLHVLLRQSSGASSCSRGSSGHDLGRVKLEASSCPRGSSGQDLGRMMKPTVLEAAKSPSGGEGSWARGKPPPQVGLLKHHGSEEGLSPRPAAAPVALNLNSSLLSRRAARAGGGPAR